ncbi:MAG: HEAT repeat domain-containing protein [Mojavia pulchra JT2-VF2]|jgi:predicted NACHT family NTPase|uniref:HEAT repeat domain-containing protein n=1 Tax=Mojavia pulchra JT2-VF2 TaxID=287848 RepID=A0A951PYZ6_9NOST|nr:HEAT repeat domain-containing protein [Mojavia pulchra JT2-VF2]
MMDWLIVWGVTQTVGFAFKPILEDLAKDAAKDWAKDLLKKIPSYVLQQFKQEDIAIAAGKALKEFFQLMQQELEDAEVSESDIEQYIQPLKQFISHKDVKVILGSAFEYNCENLDTKTLENIWYSLDLLTLPTQFSWMQLGKRYVKKVKAIIRESDKLRSLLDSQNIESIEKNTKVFGGIIPAFDLQQYQEAIKERYSNLKLDSLDTTGSVSNELKLWRIFISQNVREVRELLPQIHEIPKEHQKRLKEAKQLGEVNLEALEHYKRLYFEQPIRSVLDIINDQQNYKYIVILGDPGSGKSTLLQYLALNWAESPLNNVISQPIPFLIELRTYMRNQNEGHCKNFLEFFHQSPGSICHLNQHQLQEQLNAGNALVMFDGLDEVFDQGKREDVITAIHRFTNEYPKVRVVVTSRVIGYKPQRLRDAEFRHFMLQDLEPEQIQDFNYRWHELTFNDAVEKIRKRERLQKAIDTSAAIAELAGNPLLLTMMAILNRNQELPRDRPELYNQASRVLLHQWDVERALIEDSRLDPKTIDYKDKQAMLRQVASRMQTSGKGLAGNLISASDLETILTSYLKSIEIDKPREVARVMINQLRTRNFILCFVGAEYYAFVHRTFLEYFCAWELVWQFKETQTLPLENLKIDIFGKHWRDESWHEVLRLIAGMIEPRFVGEILEYLMAENGEKENFINLFLVAKCLAEVRNRLVIASTATKLFEQLKNLTQYDLWYYYDPYRDQEETKLVQKIRTQAITAVANTWKDHPETLAFLKQRATTDENEYVRRAAVQELARGFKDDANTIAILKDRATTDEKWDVRRVAVEELARGFKDDANTIAILKDRAIADSDSDVRRAAIEELARNFKDDIDTIGILKQRATADENEYVRCAALQELARHFKHDADTIGILKQRATADSDSDVRRAAIEELARNFKDDADTIGILKQRATTDKNEYVRLAAVQELARHFKDDADTRQILKQGAIADQNEYVRLAAVQELARHFKDNADTRQILKDRATADEKWDVRQAAVQELARHFKDDPSTIYFLQQRATADERWDVRRAAIEELARNLKYDPGTIYFLQQRATADENEYVRRAAVEELARNFKDDADTIRILKDRAINDQRWDVRRAAVEELARNFQDDTDTIRILKNCAIADEDSDVRRAAVEELARNFQDDADTIRILKNRATADDKWDVRRVAVEELARGFKNDADTIRILKDRATADESGNVRQTAVQELTRHFKDDIDTISILKDCAIADQRWDVRQVAVQELARHFKDEPEIFELFYNCAVNDPFKRSEGILGTIETNPRQVAMEIIIKQYSHHPQTLPLVNDRAENDPDQQLRKFAQSKLKQWGVRE